MDKNTSDKKVPRPEEVQKEFEDFVQKRFGGVVKVVSQEMANHKATAVEDNTKKEANDKDFQLEFDMSHDMEGQGIQNIVGWSPSQMELMTRLHQSTMPSPMSHLVHLHQYQS